MPTFSCVIPNFDGEKLLIETLKALRMSTVVSRRIIVVDDGSSDTSVHKVGEFFPEVEIIKNNENLGPTVSRNRGAAQLTDDFIVFLDNDVKVTPDCISLLHDFAAGRPKAGVVGAKIIPGIAKPFHWSAGYDPNNFFNSLGFILGSLSELVRSRRLRLLAGWLNFEFRSVSGPCLVDWVRENCFLVRRDVFSVLGGFDERFFMFFEGVDLCRRIRNHGYEVWYHPGALAYSLEGHTRPSERAKLYQTSKLFFYQKHYFYLRSNPLLLWIGNLLLRLTHAMALRICSKRR